MQWNFCCCYRSFHRRNTIKKLFLLSKKENYHRFLFARIFRLTSLFLFFFHCLLSLSLNTFSNLTALSPVPPFFQIYKNDYEWLLAFVVAEKMHNKAFPFFFSTLKEGKLTQQQQRMKNRQIS